MSSLSNSKALHKPLFLLTADYRTWTVDRCFPYARAGSDPVLLSWAIYRLLHDPANTLWRRRLIVYPMVLLLLPFYNVAILICTIIVLVAILHVERSGVSGRSRYGVDEVLPSCLEADLGCLDPLCDLLRRRSGTLPAQTHEWARGIIAALLSQLTAEDAGYLTHRGRAVLDGYLNPAIAAAHPGLTLAYLGALTKVGDACSVRSVARLYGRATQRDISMAAHACLAAIRSRLRADTPKKILLRPSSYGAQEQTLLRIPQAPCAEHKDELLRVSGHGYGNER